MARVTIEDCVKKVDDRFELVALAAQRAKNIATGSPLQIERKGEKNTVLALREIAMTAIDVEDLRENIVKTYQKERQFVPVESSEGTEISEEELAQEEAELKEIESGEQDNGELIAEETAEIKAKEETAQELSFEEDNIEIDD